MQKSQTAKTTRAKELGVSRSTLYYEKKQPAKDWKVKCEIEEILREHPSYGSPRLALALGRNHKQKVCSSPPSHSGMLCSRTLVHSSSTATMGASIELASLSIFSPASVRSSLVQLRDVPGRMAIKNPSMTNSKWILVIRIASVHSANSLLKCIA